MPKKIDVIWLCWNFQSIRARRLISAAGQTFAQLLLRTDILTSRVLIYNLNSPTMAHAIAQRISQSSMTSFLSVPRVKMILGMRHTGLRSRWCPSWEKNLQNPKMRSEWLKSIRLRLKKEYVSRARGSSQWMNWTSQASHNQAQEEMAEAVSEESESKGSAADSYW